MAKNDRTLERSAIGVPMPTGDTTERSHSEVGASVVEYGLLIAAVAVFFLAALVLMDMFGAVFEAGACDTDRGYTCTTTTTP